VTKRGNAARWRVVRKSERARNEKTERAKEGEEREERKRVKRGNSEKSEKSRYMYMLMRGDYRSWPTAVPAGHLAVHMLGRAFATQTKRLSFKASPPSALPAVRLFRTTTAPRTDYLPWQTRTLHHARTMAEPDEERPAELYRPWEAPPVIANHTQDLFFKPTSEWRTECFSATRPSATERRGWHRKPTASKASSRQPKAVSSSERTRYTHTRSRRGHFQSDPTQPATATRGCSVGPQRAGRA
jgi:hypothetical protein